MDTWMNVRSSDEFIQLAMNEDDMPGTSSTRSALTALLQVMKFMHHRTCMRGRGDMHAACCPLAYCTPYLTFYCTLGAAGTLSEV